MEIELSGTVRGESVSVRWHDGELAGSDVLLQRLDPMVEDGRCAVEDLTSVIRSLEQVAGQRLKLRVVDERPPLPGPVTSAA
jgi:hypothetical protein